MRGPLAAALVIAACASPAFAQVAEHSMYVSVVDNKGAPVTGITPKDLIVREDGQAREILSIAKDNDPLQVALLIDNSATMRDRLVDLRGAVSAFISSLRSGVQVALLTLAERPTIVAGYTDDHAALLKAVDKIITYDAGNYVIDGIAEVAEGFKKRQSARSIMVVVTGVGPELSFRHYSDAIRPLRESGASLHAIVVTSTAPDTAESGRVSGIPNALADNTGDTTPAGTDRDLVLGRMTKETGGRYEQVIAISALSAKLQQLSSEISNQYRVTFARPERLIPPKNTEVSARQSNLHARGMLAK